ncbi:hypothetical protein IWW36_004797 [Coemansia brasiliensis]|uniref:Glutamyl-tRNA(Gln) amidotransferase subunit C, mitochondrial n=1 Tax=Coemansia brasiliensis TaxID=2650707 RepID=A0A9W8LYP7_9FUNG|nr:hypothetical protein IWW36_004797 [Coemansia brasiliensis]
MFSIPPRLLCRPHLLLRGISTSQIAHNAFPLTKPAWSVSTLLQKPQNIGRYHELERDLDHTEIEHLHNLCGLTMPDPQKDEFTKASTEINQLRDFLSHIHVVSESENLDAVEPLVRIAEPVSFTADSMDGGLSFTKDQPANIGRKILGCAEQTNGPFYIVED